MADSDKGALPGMVPFVADLRLPPNPTTADIERVFNALLKDLDFDEKQRSALIKRSQKQKLEFIQQQEQHERSVPSPAWLCQEIATHFRRRLLTTTDLAIRTGRLEWVEKFCNQGGHIVLLRELGKHTAFQKFFSSNFAYKTVTRDMILDVLHTLVDCSKGSHSMLYFQPASEILVSTLDRRSPEAFTRVLSLLLPYLFVEHGPPLVYRSLKRYASEAGQKNPFRIFAEVLSCGKTNLRYDLVFAFLNGLYTSFSVNYPQQQQLGFDYEASGVTEVLAGLPTAATASFALPLKFFLEGLQSDFVDIKELFSEAVQCATVEDLTEGLKAAPRFGTFLANLFSVKYKQSEVFDELLDFLTKFLIRFRKGLIGGEPQPFTALVLNAFEYGSSEETPVEVPLPESTAADRNIPYAHLNRTFGFVADTDLEQVELTTPPSDFQRALEALSADNERLRGELLEAQAAIAKAAAESTNDEVERLRAELDAAREENVKLQERQNELIELARVIPSEQRGGAGLSASDLAQLLPRRPVDLKRALQALQLLSQKTGGGKGDAELAGLLADLEGLLKAAAQERDTIQANVDSLKTAASDQQTAAASEAANLRDLQNRIIGVGSASAAAGPIQADEDADSLAAGDTTRRIFRWEKLPDAAEWAAIRGGAVTIDAPEVERLVSTGDIPEGKLLSAVTARQYQIALKAIGRSITEIATAIRKESFSIGEPALLRIIRLPASPAEVQRLTDFNGDVSTLTEPEQLAVALYRIPGFRGKARGLIEHHRFDLGFQVTMQNLEKYSAGLKKFGQAQNLQRAFAAILSIGNEVNAGTGLGGAEGFSLSYILELRGAKTNDKGVRLVHVVARALAANGIDIVKLRAETDALVPASRVSLEGILESLKLAQAQLASRPRVPFVVASSQRVREGISKVLAVQLEADRLARTFGIRPELLKSSGVLVLAVDVGVELTRAHKENAARSEAAPARQAAGAAAPPPVAAPINVDVSKARGFVQTMVGTMQAASLTRRTTARKGPGGEDEFQKAFAKVRTVVQ